MSYTVGAAYPGNSPIGNPSNYTGVTPTGTPGTNPYPQNLTFKLPGTFIAVPASDVLVVSGFTGPYSYLNGSYTPVFAFNGYDSNNILSTVITTTVLGSGIDLTNITGVTALLYENATVVCPALAVSVRADPVVLVVGSSVTVSGIRTLVSDIRDTPSFFSILGLFVSAADAINGQAEVLVQGSYFNPPYTVGDTVSISSVPTYTGFDGIWPVLKVTQVGNKWYITIPYAYGSQLSVANPGGYINVYQPDPLSVLCGTLPPSGTCKASFAITGHTISAGAENEGPVCSLTSGVGNVFVRTQVNFVSDINYRRWATVSYNRQVFLTNELNPILFTDGATMFRYSNQQPSARYIDIFFDHLVIAWPVWGGSPSPTRVQWSDLYRINQWVPSPKNEADSYDIEEWCRTDFALYGCTGLGRIGNTMWVYTPTAIVSMRYQGRIKSPVFNQSLTGTTAGGGGPIMIVGDKVMKDIGNSLQWGLIVYKDMHYFWDGVEQDFYRFDGNQTESIGIKIKGYFLSNVNPAWPLFQATWGYARPGRQEIVWVFVSNQQTSVVFDKAIVYNWKTGRWYTQSVENTHCYTGPCLPAGRADDLEGMAQNLSGTADQLLASSALSPPLWGSNGTVLRESTDADPDSALLPQDTPTLITKDYGYDDLEHIKEASSIVLHAMDRYKSGVCVSLSVRDNLDDPVVYPNTSLYRYDPEEKRLGLPRDAGRLLRYRFQPSTRNGPVRDFTWGGFVENVKRKVTDA